MLILLIPTRSLTSTFDVTFTSVPCLIISSPALYFSPSVPVNSSVNVNVSVLLDSTSNKSETFSNCSTVKVFSSATTLPFLTKSYNLTVLLELPALSLTLKLRLYAFSELPSSNE